MLSSEEFSSPPRNKADLLARIEQSWATLQETLQGLSEEQLEGSKDQEGWSALDHLAHIAAWEDMLTGLLQGRPLHEAFGLDLASYEQVGSTDELNALLHERLPQRSAQEALASHQQSHQRAVAALTALPHEDWSKPIFY